MSGPTAGHAMEDFVEITGRSLAVLREGRTRQLPLERDAGGALVPVCSTRVRAELAEIFGRAGWGARRPVWCAIGGRGVLLRRFQLPRVPAGELSRLVALQIESEFPLAPEELAWGFVVVGEGTGGAEAGRTQEVLVAAVRKSVIDAYAALFADTGRTPIFTLAGLARHALCLPGGGTYSLLHVEEDEAEWLAYRDGFPTRLRVVPLATTAEGDRDPAVGSPTDLVAQALTRNAVGQRLYVSGVASTNDRWRTSLGTALGADLEWQAVDASRGNGVGLVLAGLRQAAARNGAGLLFLNAATEERATTTRAGVPWRWVALAVVLLLGWLALPYVEAMLFRNRLARQLKELKANEPRLALIDRQLGFLRYLKNGQPPHLETLTVLAKVLPPGAKIDSLGLNRRGELSLRVTVRQPQEAADFRTKMVDSGYFASVVVEEQAPSADRQKVSVRLSAQLKPSGVREGVALLAEGGDPKAKGATNTPAAVKK